MRSSATAEDLPTASFAGQQDTYLNVRGDESLLAACRHCFASLFTDRAIHYRVDEGFDHFEVALSIGVMKMVRSDLASSGVMFSLDTESGFPDVVFITGAWGLGENIVQGAVDPDEFYVYKPTYEAGHRAVLRRVLGDKAVKMVFVEGETKHTTRNVPTPKADRARYCLGDDDVLELAAAAIEDRAPLRAADGHGVGEGRSRRADLTWSKRGRRRSPPSDRRTSLESYSSKAAARSSSKAAPSARGSPRARAASSRTPPSSPTSEPGEVLVADTTTPDWEPVMKTASAIVTNRGGRTCHAAIVARELGLPAVVGTDDGTDLVPRRRGRDRVAAPRVTPAGSTRRSCVPGRTHRGRWIWRAQRPR